MLLTLLGGRQEGHPACNNRGVGCRCGCLEQGVDLNTAQLMPLPLTVSCFSKIQIGFTFLVPANPGSPRQHTRLTALFPGLPRLASTRKVKPIWTLLKQETVSGSGIRWAVCKSAPHSRQITTPAPHHSAFYRAGCPSCHPTNSVRAMKAQDKGPRQKSVKWVCVCVTLIQPKQIPSTF